MEPQVKSMTPNEVLALCREKDVKAINLRYCDLRGAWQQTTVPTRNLSEEIFSEGLGLDACSLFGAPAHQHNDLVILPQPGTVFLDPFAELNTLNVICQIMDPVTLDSSSLDPRFVAQKAMNYLQQTGLADQAVFGSTPEFYTFDGVDFEQSAQSGFYFLDLANSDNTSDAISPVHRTRLPEETRIAGSSTFDQLTDFRNAVMQSLLKCEVAVNSQRQSAGAGMKLAIDLEPQDLLSLSDDLLTFKYVVKSVARQHDQTVTFMPQPIFGEPGSGMKISLSLWKDGQAEFTGAEYGGLSDKALYAIGGIQQHAHAIAAFTNPTTNSYKRLAGDPAAPAQLGYTKRNRSAAIRIPTSISQPDAKSIEIRFPDPSCNPYLALSAILMAAIDGIQNKIEPGDPLDSNWEEGESSDQPRLISQSLSQSLRALEKGCAFLLKGEVFTEDLIASWIENKFRTEVDPANSHPNPFEFCLYYDV